MINIYDFQEKIKQINNYTQTTKKYQFYYDESNNYRKIKITESGLNNNKAFYNDYVLGGFCHYANQKPDIEKLFKEQLTRYKNGELKGKTLFKNCDFIEALNKKETGILLNWIKENGFIHYSSLNSFYYSIIDLVDSFFAKEPENKLPKEISNICKSELYLLLFTYKDEFIQFAHTINYPNIKEKDVPILCQWLIELINMVNINEEFNLEFIKQIIKSNKKNKELIFLLNNQERTIVECYYELRQQKCIIFDESTHIFDEESYDEELMKNNPLTKDNITVFKNYTFENSKSNRLIQVSDFVSHIIAKYLNFIDHNNINDIKRKLTSCNTLEKENLKLLIYLIEKSYNEDTFLIGTINALEINTYRNNIKDYIKTLLT